MSQPSHFTRFRFNVEDYHLMAEVGILKPDDRVELLNGEIIEMSSIRSAHASCVDSLAEELIYRLRNTAIVPVQNPIHLNNYNEPEPDLAIVELKSGKYRAAHPEAKDVYWLIEVSDTSLDKDVKIKLPIYASTNIPEVWLVNLQDDTLIRYTVPVDGAYTHIQTYRAGERISNDLVKNLAVSDILG